MTSEHDDKQNYIDDLTQSDTASTSAQSEPPNNELSISQKNVGVQCCVDAKYVARRTVNTQTEKDVCEIGVQVGTSLEYTEQKPSLYDQCYLSGTDIESKHDSFSSPLCADEDN